MNNRLESIIQSSKNLFKKGCVFTASIALATTVLTSSCSWNKSLHTPERYNTISIDKSQPHLTLKNNEYIVPKNVLRVFHFMTSNNLNIEKEWGDPAIGIYGTYISYNHMPGNLFDFLDSIYSKKEHFFDLCLKYTTLTKEEIKNYHEVLTTSGNIVLGEDYPASTLFHERVHKYISEALKPGESDTLKKVSKEFSSWIYEEKFVNEKLSSEISNFLKREVTILEAFAQKYIDPQISLAIRFGNWQELYAHFAEHQVYPQGEIQPEAYTALKQKHPGAFNIYNEIVRNLLQESGTHSYKQEEKSTKELQWPLDNPTITQKFGENKGTVYRQGHLGIDMTAYFGAPVKAAADGVVAAKGSDECPNFYEPECNYRFGNWVMIRHEELKLGTVYSHLKEPSDKNIGDKVKQREIVGHEGGSGFQFDTETLQPAIGDPSRHHLDFMVGIFKPYTTLEGKTDFQLIKIYDPLELLPPLK